MLMGISLAAGLQPAMPPRRIGAEAPHVRVRVLLLSGDA